MAWEWGCLKAIPLGLGCVRVAIGLRTRIIFGILHRTNTGTALCAVRSFLMKTLDLAKTCYRCTVQYNTPKQHADARFGADVLMSVPLFQEGGGGGGGFFLYFSFF